MSPDEERDDNAGVIALPPLIFALPLLAGLALDRLAPVALVPAALARALGWPLLGAGVSLMAWFVATLNRAGTAIDVREPVTRLVTHGPFRRSRNPAYLAMTLVYSGVTLLANALWAALLLPFALLVMRRGVIDREERYLERRFGDEYRRYRGRVRRWV